MYGVLMAVFVLLYKTRQLLDNWTRHTKHWEGMHTSGTQVSKQSTFYNKSFGLETETRDAIIIIIFSISNQVSYIPV